MTTVHTISNKIKGKMLESMREHETYDSEVFDLVFIHHSLGVPNNRRLASLGGAVLSLIIREHLFVDDRDWDPDDVSATSPNRLETDENFARHATDIGLSRRLKYGDMVDYEYLPKALVWLPSRRREYTRPIQPADVEKSVEMRATVFKAYFGAVYLTEGLDGALDLAERFGVIQ